MKNKLSAENLSLYYGDFQALKNVTIAFPEREVTALIGPSGCGKSTLLRTFNRMNDLAEGCRTVGRVLLDGEDVSRMDETALRRRVGMVFQKASPFPMSIYDNIAYGPRSHGRCKKSALDETVEKALVAAALWDEVRDRLKKPALGLSGGQQQRLCIARALAAEPEVLLMDEPTSALDPISTAHIEQLIGSLSERYTIIIVTHNMQQAQRVASRTAFLLSGEVIEYGATEQVFFSPADNRTRGYILG